MIHQPLRSMAKQSRDMRCTHRRACTCNHGEFDLNKLIGLIPSGDLESHVLNGWTERERLYLIRPKHLKTIDQQPRDLPGFPL